jgi:hypothetical protein
VFSFLQDIMQIVKINSKKFLVISVFLYCCQRVRVWLVALARTKLVNKNEPEEIPKEFPSKQLPQQLIIHGVTKRLFC